MNRNKRECNWLYKIGLDIYLVVCERFALYVGEDVGGSGCVCARRAESRVKSAGTAD